VRLLRPSLIVWVYFLGCHQVRRLLRPAGVEPTTSGSGGRRVNFVSTYG
jgi:hypothetical protein